MTVNIGIVGGGEAAEKVALSLSGMDEFRIVGVYSNRIESSFIYNHIDVINSYEELLKKQSIDVVYIATPVISHIPVAKQAMDQGVNVLIEKPAALSYEEIYELNKEYKYRKLIKVAFKKRFGPSVKEILRNLELNNQNVLISYFWRIPLPKKDWRRDVSQSGGGVVMDLGSHIFDLFEYLLGPIKSIRSLFFNQDRSWLTENEAEIEIEFRSGSKGQISIGWLSKELYQELKITAPSWTISLTRTNRYQDQLELSEGETTIWRKYFDPKDEYRGLFQAIELMTNEEIDHLPSIDDALRNHQLIEAVYQSASAGKLVYV